MSSEELKVDCSKKQKKGIHFIIASVAIWIMVLIVQLTNLEINYAKKLGKEIIYYTDLIEEL